MAEILLWNVGFSQKTGLELVHIDGEEAKNGAYPQGRINESKSAKSAETIRLFTILNRVHVINSGKKESWKVRYLAVFAKEREETNEKDAEL